MQDFPLTGRADFPNDVGMSPRFLIALAFVAVLPMTAGAAEGVEIIQQPDRLRVEINGGLFTEYFYTGKSHPWVAKSKGAAAASALVTNLPKHVYFYPVLGPGGVPMTRNWPMKDVEGERMGSVRDIEEDDVITAG